MRREGERVQMDEELPEDVRELARFLHIIDPSGSDPGRKDRLKSQLKLKLRYQLGKLGTKGRPDAP